MPRDSTEARPDASLAASRQRVACSRFGKTRRMRRRRRKHSAAQKSLAIAAASRY